MAKKQGVRTIKVIRQQKVDRLDDPSTTAPTEHEIDGCAIMPRSSHEEGKGWVIVKGRMVVAPHGSDIEAEDKVQIVGEETIWEVDGEPGDYEDRRGKGKATLVYLKTQGT